MEKERRKKRGLKMRNGEEKGRKEEKKKGSKKDKEDEEKVGKRRGSGEGRLRRAKRRLL